MSLRFCGKSDDGCHMKKTRPVAHLGIRTDLKPAGTEVTFTPKGVDGRGIVFADFSFLSVVPYTGSEVRLQSGVE